MIQVVAGRFQIQFDLQYIVCFETWIYRTSLTLPEQIEGLSEWCGPSHNSGSPNRSHYHSSTHATLFVPMALPSSA